MKLIEIFDYVYYRIYAYHLNFKSERDIPGLSSVCILTVSQSFNLLTFFLLYELINGVELEKVGIHGYHFVIIAMGVLVLNIIRYLRGNRIFPLVEKWGKEEKEVRKQKGYKVVAYIVLSVIIFFGLAGIIGSGK